MAGDSFEKGVSLGIVCCSCCLESLVASIAEQDLIRLKCTREKERKRER